MSTGIQPVELEVHRERLLSQVVPLAPRRIEVAGGFAALHGAVLAEDVCSTHPLPLWDNSAMESFFSSLETEKSKPRSSSPCSM